MTAAAAANKELACGEWPKVNQYIRSIYPSIRILLTIDKNIIDLKAVFTSLSGSNVLLLPDTPQFTIVAVSNDYLKDTGRTAEELIGRHLFEAFPNNPGDPHQTSEKTVRASLEYALKHKETHYLPLQQYDIPVEDGSYIERFWKAHNRPVLNESGEVVYLIHSIEDVTEKIKTEKRELQLKSIEKAFGLFMQAPEVISLLKGKELVIELANEAALKLWGKRGSIVGKPLLEVIPEMAGQGIIELLHKVLETGQPYIAKEEPLVSFANGKKEVYYFDRVYQPYYDEGETKPTGVLTLSHNVTELVLAKKKVQESEEKYRSLFETMDQGFCVLEMIFDDSNRPVDYRFLEYNPVFENQTGLKNAVGQTARELVPDLESHWSELYGKVALTGEGIRFIEESRAMGRWFEVYAFRVGGQESRKVALLFTDITARKKADEAIKQSENNLRNMILQAPVAMGILRGPEFIVEIANDRLFELWGRGKEDLLQKSIFVGLPEVRDQGYEELLNGVFTTGKSFSAQGIPVNAPRNGSIVTLYINLLYEAYREGDGTISGVMVVATDVTEQVMAQRRLEESEATLQQRVEERTAELEKQKSFVTSVLESSMDGIYALKAVRNPEGIITDFQYLFTNTNIAKLLHLEVDEIIGASMLSLIPENRENGFFELFCRILETGETFQDETHFVTQNIDSWYRYVIVPLDQNTLVVSTEDITEKKQTTLQIEEQRNLLDNILHNSSNGISVSRIYRDENGTVVDALTILANDAAIKYIGLPKDIYLSRRATELEPGIIGSPYYQSCIKTLETGEPFFTQYQMESTGRWLELTVSRLDHNHLIQIFTDVTPIKEAQLQLERTVQELKRSNT
ncbi:MAG TPA: PAS domain-containing protein, partial [Flavisolibacter sp.]|nr:PAS domain-containing protein [Flavisolibacter sp.]